VNLVPTSSRLIAALVGTVLIVIPLPASAAPAPAPDAPELQAIDLTPAGGSARLGRSFGAPERATGALVVTQRDTKPFSLVGATWADPDESLAGTVEVRTRSVADHRWTGWQALDSDGRSPAEPGSRDSDGRGRTDPLWVDTSDAVEARVATGRALPEGLRLDLINGDEAAPAGRAAAPMTQPLPRLITRAGWGANEKLVEPPEYSPDVQVLFVHHTAGTNSYNCADSARIVRSIQGYHVLSNRWNDIGYNFLVDKCGNLFEGRKGGVSLPVLGAHTLGFNTHSSAIAVIGNYSARTVPNAVRNVIAQIAAYKLGTYGNLANGRTTMVSSGGDRYPKGRVVSMARISGHRDAGQTACPGDALYSQLPSFRAIASGAPTRLRLLGMTGATRHGTAYYTKGLVSLLWTTTTQSALLNRFNVYVDGVLAASAIRSHRRATLRLPPGRHKVTVRAVHLSGRTASFTRLVIADTTAPRFTTGPAVVLRRGPLAGSVPIRVGWSAADAGGMRTVTMTSPASRDLGGTAIAWNGVARRGVATPWSLRAIDRAGNTANASVTRTVGVFSEITAARTGRWAGLRGPAYLGGGALRGVTAGSSLTWTVVTRSAGLAVSRGGTSGRIAVYVDGVASGIVDLRSATSRHQQAVWVRNWGETGRHTVKIVVLGAGAVLDGLAVMR
jgi:hypothetical protein